jgi:hypothetical protein
MLEEARKNPDIEVLEEPRDFQFNDKGDLF